MTSSTAQVEYLPIMHIGKHRLSSALIIALAIVFAVMIGGLPTFSHWIQQSNTALLIKSKVGYSLPNPPGGLS